MYSIVDKNGFVITSCTKETIISSTKEAVRSCTEDNARMAASNE